MTTTALPASRLGDLLMVSSAHNDRRSPAAVFTTMSIQSVVLAAPTGAAPCWAASLDGAKPSHRFSKTSTSLRAWPRALVPFVVIVMTLPSREMVRVPVITTLPALF